VDQEWRRPEPRQGLLDAAAGVEQGRALVRDLDARGFAGAQVLLEIWNRSEPPAVSLGAALATIAPGSAGTLRQLVRRSAIDGWPRDVLERRLDHFIGEDRRVPDALEAVGAGDVPRLAALSQASQADAETLLGNQVPETIALARAAREQGAFAASSFGAGFGGSVWALVEHDAEEFAARWHPGAFVASPGPPLTPLV